MVCREYNGPKLAYILCASDLAEIIASALGLMTQLARAYGQ